MVGHCKGLDRKTKASANTTQQYFVDHHFMLTATGYYAIILS